MPLKQFERQGKAMAWETPQTFSGSWGYHRDEGTWKSTKQCLEMLIYAVSKGGNLLLNVGPTGRGEFDYRAMERLSGMGQWMRYHGRAIYSCSKAPEDFPPPRNCVLTCNAEVGRLYLHIQDWPATPGTMGLSTHLYWENVSPDRFQYAQLLNDASEVKFWRPDTDKLRRGGYSENTTILQLPVQPAADVPVPVVEIFLK
jgi:alpha-L-fucosidase